MSRSASTPAWAAEGCEIANFEGFYLGQSPLVSAAFWASDHLSKRSRSVDPLSGTVARNAHVEAKLNHPLSALTPAKARRWTRTAWSATVRRARTRRHGAPPPPSSSSSSLSSAGGRSWFPPR